MIAAFISVQGLEQFRELAQLIDDATRGAEERAKTRHERFNLFTTLLSAHDEVRLHTRFLHCLLDPAGHHDCGTLFLNLFFETLAEHPATAHFGELAPFTSPSPTAVWKVENEAPRDPFGQIDLLLESGLLRIAIENKIYAGEQANQLARYTEYLSLELTPRLVIYLTLDGKPSKTHEGAPYLRISYAQHILRWLDKCIWETVRITSINQTLLQYREVVRYLTGHTLTATAMKTIADFIQQHPDIIRYRAQLAVGIEAVRANFLKDLAAGIKAQLTSDGYTVSSPNQKGVGFGLGNYSALVITPLPASALHALPVTVWLENITSLQTLGVGIKTPAGYNTLPQPAQQILNDMNRLLDGESPAPSSRQTRPNDAWPTGLLRIANPGDDTQLADFLEKDQAALVSDFCAKIYGHIAALERAYLQSLAPSLPVTQ